MNMTKRERGECEKESTLLMNRGAQFCALTPRNCKDSKETKTQQPSKSIYNVTQQKKKCKQRRWSKNNYGNNNTDKICCNGPGFLAFLHFFYLLLRKLLLVLRGTTPLMKNSMHRCNASFSVTALVQEKKKKKGKIVRCARDRKKIEERAASTDFSFITGREGATKIGGVFCKRQCIKFQKSRWGGGSIASAGKKERRGFLQRNLTRKSKIYGSLSPVFPLNARNERVRACWRVSLHPVPRRCDTLLETETVPNNESKEARERAGEKTCEKRQDCLWKCRLHRFVQRCRRSCSPCEKKHFDG